MFLSSIRLWWESWFKRDTRNEQTRQLLAAAVVLGLSERDATNAQQMLAYDEAQLAFDIIVTQLFEYGTPVTVAFYEQLEACADSMNIPTAEYSILLLLVKDD